MEDYIADEKRFLKTPAPVMLVQSLGDSSVNLVLRAWAKSGDYWQTNWDATRALKERFDAAGLNIPFPQRDVHIISQ
jgi:small conductance mechanosensitive channel